MIIAKKEIEQLLIDVFMRAGLSEEQADIVADNLVYAQMRGINSHGIVQTAGYVKKMRIGKIHTTPNMRILKESPVTLALDADLAAGAVAGKYAMELTIAKAKSNGIAMTTVKNATHYGVSAYYAKMALEEDMIGIAFTNSVKLMAPYGGYERELGTNPICIAVPAGLHNPIIYDGATSIAAYNKIFFAYTEGNTIPDIWALDNKGHVTVNPKDIVVDKGAVLPFGDYKGYGLAVMVNVITGILSGGSSVLQIDGSVTEDSEATAYCFMAIDISKFTEVDVFKNTVDLFIDRLKNSAKRDGTEEILVPGELEDRNYNESLLKGVFLPKGVVRELEKVMADLNIASPFN